MRLAFNIQLQPKDVSQTSWQSQRASNIQSIKPFCFNFKKQVPGSCSIQNPWKPASLSSFQDPLQNQEEDLSHHPCQSHYLSRKSYHQHILLYFQWTNKDKDPTWSALVYTHSQQSKISSIFKDSDAIQGLLDLQHHAIPKPHLHFSIDLLYRLNVSM